MDAFGAVQESATIAHSDELETSLYLQPGPRAGAPGAAVPGSDVAGQYVSSDSTSNYPVRFSDYWGRWTRDGVHGDPTVATAAKGAVIYEAAVTGLLGVVDEWRAWPLADRQDAHESPVQPDIRW